MNIDLRSDTLTKPTATMLETMFKAQVGDCVFDEDPTVNNLEALVVDMFGMEAAIFCPSGTMTNQLAIKTHTQPGDEVICDKLSHIYQYEGGGIALNSGASVALIDGNRGRVTAEQVEECIQPNDLHKPISRLVSLENTCNKGGGAIYAFAEIEKTRELCSKHGLALHLDGARLFNAIIETNETPKDYGRVFDSISICLSKGLGAPVGSLLLGNKEFIMRAKRFRKAFGGGMRQAGYLAAAGIYALENNIELIKDDHQRAKLLGQAVEKLPEVEECLPVETNIVIFRLKPEIDEKQFLQKLSDKRIKAVSMGKGLVRFVTHLDYTEKMHKTAINILAKI